VSSAFPEPSISSEKSLLPTKTAKNKPTPPKKGEKKKQKNKSPNKPTNPTLSFSAAYILLPWPKSQD
jgi:hypothetical protein